MRHAWVSRIAIITLVGGLCLVGYGLAHAGKHDKPRFRVLSKDPAWVVDRTTGLQWEKAPLLSPGPWEVASTHCTDLGDGSRLPEVEELFSLLDYSKIRPALPDNSPFQTITEQYFWSATSLGGSSSSAQAWGVSFNEGDVLPSVRGNMGYAWCVR